MAPQGGKRKSYEKGGFLKKEDVYKVRIKAYAEYINSGFLFTPSEMSVSDYFHYCLEEYIKKLQNKYISNLQKIF